MPGNKGDGPVDKGCAAPARRLGVTAGASGSGRLSRSAPFILTSFPPLPSSSSPPESHHSPPVPYRFFLHNPNPPHIHTLLLILPPPSPSLPLRPQPPFITPLTSLVTVVPTRSACNGAAHCLRQRKPPVSLLPSPLPSRPINPTPSLQYKDSRRQRRTSMYRL